MDSWIDSIKLRGQRLALAHEKIQAVPFFGGTGLPPIPQGLEVPWQRLKEWDQPMRDYIEAIRAGKGDVAIPLCCNCWVL